MAKKKNSFSGSLGFVLAAAGSAVGVGNIWRFPYLCAKDGGGLFLLVYLVLVATFGFVLLTTDVAIGRRTKENALRAFGTLHPKWKFVGYLTFLVQRQIVKDFLIKFTKIYKKGARSTVWLLTPRLIDYIFPFSRSLQRYA